MTINNKSEQELLQAIQSCKDLLPMLETDRKAWRTLWEMETKGHFRGVALTPWNIVHYKLLKENEYKIFHTLQMIGKKTRNAKLSLRKFQHRLNNLK